MTEDYRVSDDPLREGPSAAPEPPPRVTTRSVRRPGKGRGPTTRKPPSKARARKAPAAPETSPEDAIRGVLQIPAAGLIMAGQKLGNLPLVADGATILYHGPALAAATVQIAENDPRIMALIEKLVTFGPYGLFLTVVFAMSVQGARNHEATSPELLESLGAMKPEEIIARAGMDIEVQVSPNGQAATPDGAPTED